MRKSLQLQAQMCEEFGACVFDVTLDCEDGAPVGGEAGACRAGGGARCPWPATRRALRCASTRSAIRAFEQDIATIAGKAGRKLCHIMIPKVESVADVEQRLPGARRGRRGRVAAARADRIAGGRAPRIRHRGASAGAVAQFRPDGFRLGPRRRHPGGGDGPAKASSRTRWWCAPSWRSRRPAMPTARCRRTAWSRNSRTPGRWARRRGRAAREFGFTRMWSIHPDQIRPILEAFAPSAHEIEIASKIIAAAAAGRLGADQLRGQTGGPRELPLLLAGAGAGPPHRPEAAGRSAGLVRRRPAVLEHSRRQVV